MAIRENEAVTGVVRLSFVRMPGENGKYSVTLLIPKSDAETLRNIRNAEEAARERHSDGRKKPPLKSGMHDGDGERPNGGEYGEECKGMWIVNASSLREPLVYMAEMKDLYSGCYCSVKINVYAYEKDGSRGLAYGLQGLRYDRPGEPLFATATASDFGLGEEEAGILF